jgi:hypothetical protein
MWVFVTSTKIQQSLKRTQGTYHLIVVPGVSGRVPELKRGIWIVEFECEEAESLSGEGVAFCSLVDELGEEAVFASADISGQHDFEQRGIYPSSQ